MKSPTLTLKISEDIDGFAVAAQTMQNINVSWNYLQIFRLKTEHFKWHGKLQQAPAGNINGGYILVDPIIAKALQLSDDDTIHITTSKAGQVEFIQAEAVATKKKFPKMVEGLEVELNGLYIHQGKKVQVQSCDPGPGYLGPQTTVEILNTSTNDNNSSTVSTVGSSNGSIPRKGFNALVGLDSIIETIRQRVIFPIKQPNMTAKFLGGPLKGAILHGPYGIGKTAIARATSEEAGVTFIEMDIAIASHPLAGPMYIQSLYEEAAEKKEGAIIYIDEIDAIASEDGFSSLTVRTLQTCMDGLDVKDNVFTLATTNHLHKVADGVRRSGRLDLVISVGLPDRTAREQLSELFLQVERKSDAIDMDRVAEITASFTPADIKTVVKQAGLAALHRYSSGDTRSEITQKDLEAEIAAYQPTGARLLGVKPPKVGFDQLYGIESLKREIIPILDLISGKRQATYSGIKNLPMLLYGPPGTGKTWFAQATADYLGVQFVYQSAASFKNKWVGQTEANIRKLFNTGRTYAPVVIFIDEIDAIGRQRTGSEIGRHTGEALNELLVQMEGFSGNEGMYVIAATNQVQILDDALLSRFGFQFELPLPDKGQRMEVLKGYFGQLPTDIVQLDYQLIADYTNDWSQRQLAGLYGKCCMKLDLEGLSSVTNQSLQHMIRDMKPGQQSQRLQLTGGMK